jgi:hypothetical protein
LQATVLPPSDGRASGEERFVARKLLQTRVLARSEHAQVFHAAAAAEGSNKPGVQAAASTNLKKQTPGTKSNPIQN